MVDMQQYMIQIINNLEERGYRKLNPDSNNVYGRAQGDAVYVVVIGSVRNLDADSLKRFNNKLIFDISMQTHARIDLLNILMTPDGMFDEAIKEIVDRVENVWLFTEDFGKLYVFDNQPSDFDNLYGTLDKQILEADEKTRRHIVRMFGIVTPILVLLNILVYIAGRFFESATGSLLELKLAINVPAIKDGQYYRLFTAMFTHFGLAHLVGNMVCLAALGARAESILGKAMYAAVYIFIGLAAAASSYIDCMNSFSYAYAAGASGAIFGLLGVLVAIAVVNKGHVKDLTLMNMIMLFVLTVVNGYMSYGIDNVAHISGFAVGLVVGFLLMLTNQKVVKRSRVC